MRTLRLALAQINTTVGDIAGNAERILARVREAASLGADIVAFPELAVTGYPPEDLLLKPEFIAANLRALQELAAQTGDTIVICGFADRRDDLFNAAAIMHSGQARRRLSQDLPAELQRLRRGPLLPRRREPPGLRN